MSCAECIHCQKLGVGKGGLSLLSVSDQTKAEETGKEIETPFSGKKGVRGRAREYTAYFETGWKAYGRKEQKFESFAVWTIRAQEVGGEPELLSLVLTALKWQTTIWGPDGWKYAPYFERYLKRRKWEDEAPPVASAPVLKPAETFEQRDARARREAQERRLRAAEDVDRKAREADAVIAARRVGGES